MTPFQASSGRPWGAGVKTPYGPQCDTPVHLLPDSVLECPPGAFPLFSFPPRLKSELLWFFFFNLFLFPYNAERKEVGMEGGQGKQVTGQLKVRGTNDF